MAILDGQNYFSDLANGDKPTAVTDNPSAYVIDQQGKNSIFTEGGGAYRAMFIKAVVQAAFVSGGGGTIQAVLQDSSDNVTYADQLVGPSRTAAQAALGTDLFVQPTRIPSKLGRYIRLVYRIGTAVFTAGTLVAFLTPTQDITDLSQRLGTGTVSKPTGALDESTANGVLAS